jgi:hypothetical protein
MRNTRHPSSHAPTPIELLTRVVTLILTVGSIVIAILFAGITYSAFVHELIPAVISKESLLWKSSIVLYFTSWFAGVHLDLAREAKIFHLNEPVVRIDLKSAALACFIFVLFGIMYFIEDIQTGKGESLLYQLGPLIQLDENKKSEWILWISAHGVFLILGVINFLWVFNIFVWRWFVEYFIKPISRRSRAHYRSEGDNFGIVKTDILNEYLDGDWQWSRYKWGIGYLLSIDIISLSS